MPNSACCAYLELSKELTAHALDHFHCGLVQLHAGSISCLTSRPCCIPFVVGLHIYEINENLCSSLATTVLVGMIDEVADQLAVSNMEENAWEAFARRLPLH